MASVQLISKEQINLQGELKFPVIMQLRNDIEALLADLTGTVSVDFSDVTEVDSSALSFWLCCLRFAAAGNVELRAQNVPVEMQSFAGLVGLDQQFR